MSEYTKGPWKATKIEKGKFHIERDEPPSDHNYVPIACIDHSRDWHDATRQVTAPADANLIAACPTMFEFIEKKAGEGDAEAQSIIDAINHPR